MTRGRRAGATLAVAFSAVLAGLAGCASSPRPRVVDGRAYGVTREPFHRRWWQYYERGVSWSLGGFWAEAEADFRACLASRRTDARRARTYGMHFTQCFAHRERGAALIELQRYADARRELLASLAQEPSEKARWLLTRIDALEAGREPPAPTAPPEAALLVLDNVTRNPDGGVRVQGRAFGGQPFAVDAAGARRALPAAPDGTFAADLAAGEAPAAGGAQPLPLPVPAEPAAPAAPPELALDGPADGALLVEPVAWYRFHLSAPGGAASLVARDAAGEERGAVDVAGVAAGGMIAVRLQPGEQVVEVVATDRAGARGVARRTLRCAPRPDQDARLRAAALLVPLATPAEAEPMRPGDDHRFGAALSGDARFRLVDARGEALLSRELALVEAGYVDRETAARLGRRLHARYVLAATLRRGRGDIECFVRVVQAESGHEVAAADAYLADERLVGDDAFFRALAARLRQAFPVLAAGVAADGRDAEIDAGTEHGVVDGMRFHVLRADRDIVDEATGAVLLPGERHAIATYEVDDRERRTSRAHLVGGVPSSGAAVSE